MNFNRRQALAAAGLGSAAWFLPWLRPGRANAAAIDIPKRIVIYWASNTIRPYYNPLPTGANPAATETDYALGELHTPLAAFKNRMVFFDNLDMTSADLDPGPFGNAHLRGDMHSLVAASTRELNIAGGPSIDQFIAQNLNKTRPLTPFPSLELLVSVYGASPESSCSFDNAGRPVPLQQNPVSSFSRLFAGSTQSPTARDHRKSVLDYVQAETRAVRGRASKLDLQRIDSHFSTVRDLEARLDVVRACSPPAYDTGVGKSGGPLFEAQLDAHARIVASALACDLTRVVTINVDSPPQEWIGYTAGAFGTSDWHDLSHKTAENGELHGDAAAVAMMKVNYVKHSDYFGRFLNHLDTIIEADGKSVLDHTMVLYCGQIASASHDLHECPWIVAGGGAGGVRTGRYLQYERNTQGVGAGHNRLFVSMANFAGVPAQAFGNPALVQGPLPGLLT